MKNKRNFKKKLFKIAAHTKIKVYLLITTDASCTNLFHVWILKHFSNFQNVWRYVPPPLYSEN